MPKSQQLRRLSLVSRAGFFSFLAPKVHLQGASALSQCRGWRGRGSWKNQENLFLIIMGRLHIITALVYRALSQTLSHLIPTVNGESGGGGGNRAISIGPTLSNRTTGGSETLNDLSRITKPVSSGAGNASFMTLISWPQLPLLELYFLESESDSFRLWISSVCPLSPNVGKSRLVKDAWMDGAQNRMVLNAMGRGFDKKETGCQRVPQAGDQLGVPEARRC